MNVFERKRAETLLEDWAFDSISTPHVKSQVSALTDMIDTTNRAISQVLHKRTAAPIFTRGKLQTTSSAKDVHYAGFTKEIHATETRAKGGSKPPLSGNTRIGKDPRIGQLDELLTTKLKSATLEHVRIRALLFNHTEKQVAEILEIPRSTLQSQWKKAILFAIIIK